MGVSKLAFTWKKTKAVDNVQTWVNIVYRKANDLKDYYFHFFVCFKLGYMINVSAQMLLAVKL